MCRASAVVPIVGLVGSVEHEVVSAAADTARCLATASWLLEQPAAAQHATAVRMIETVLAEEQEEAV